MFAKVFSFGVYGLNGFLVTVETDTSNGLPSFDIVGLPDSAVKESKERVRSALKNSGFTFPISRITVNLAPADIKKTGPVYDLPILISLLCSTKQIKNIPNDYAFMGELSLDGKLRGINGILPMVISASKSNIKHIFLPKENAIEASSVENVNIYPCENITQIIDHLKTEDKKITPIIAVDFSVEYNKNNLDFSDVHGQLEARRALEIAASGGHNVIMIGSPGSGKSMLAKRMPSILPPLTRDEAIEITKIYSVSGILERNSGLVNTRPFRSPHHSVSSVGLAGGGSIPHPGEISLAHNGVLFLDELPEFKRDALEILRQPLEDGELTISRANSSATFPCKILLISAMNPCPCGYLGHPTKQCTCSQASIEKYLQKISGPLLDRIDLHIDVSPVQYDEISTKEGGEKSEDILKRVMKARAVAQERFKGMGITCNAQIPSALLHEICKCTDDANVLLKSAFEKLGLSARAYDRILKVSRTIADLDDKEIIDIEHIAEALQYRNLDKKYWQN